MKHKNTWKSFAVAASALLMATSCSENPLFSSATDSAKGKVALQVSVANPTNTRSLITGSTLPNGSTYSIYALDEDGSSISPNYEGTTVLYQDGESRIMEDPIYLPENGSKINVIALYGTKGIYDSKGNIVNIPIDVEQQQDYLLGNSTGTVNYDAPIASIEFKHLMSRITLNITKSADSTVTYEIPSVSIRNVTKDAIMSIVGNAEKHSLESVSTEKIGFYTKPTENAVLRLPTDTVSVNFLILPIQHDSVKIELDSQKKSFILPISDFKEGEQYTFNVNINKKQVEEVKEHEYVDLGLPSGTLWATHNLDLERSSKETANIEDYGSFVAYADPTGKKTWDNDSVGYELPDSIFGTDLDIAYVEWGKEWRLPTDREMYELRKQCTWEFGESNGVKCAKVMGPNGNSILFPLGGEYYKNVYYEKGKTGYYWVGEKDPRDQHAKCLIARESDVGSNSGWSYGTSLPSKINVRPVRNK